MPKTLSTLFCAGLLCAGAAWAGTVEVRYEQPERFSDVGPRRDADAVQQQLTGIFDALAARQLPASQVLRIVVTDVDLAGEIPPGAVRLHDVRVMGRHPDWPRITLRYSLQDGGRVLTEGSEVVSDMAYLSRSTQASGSGALPYERRMLADWFDKRFGRAASH